MLEDACINLDTVATNILGASEDQAQGRLRSKRPALRLALRGRMRDHHRLMLLELMEDLEFVERKIERLEKRSGLKPIWRS